MLSNLKKLQSKSPEVLLQCDEVIKKQMRDEIIERVDLDDYLSRNQGVSFLPHTAVIRENAETTKCRIVFMANLAEKFSGGLSHNQISFSGQNLNSTLFDSLLYLRFDKYLYVFDICSAFLSIKIREEDTRKLLFLWFDNVSEGNFKITALDSCDLGLVCALVQIYCCARFIIFLLNVRKMMILDCGT